MALTIYHYLRGFHADDSPLNAGMEKAVAGLAGGIVSACARTGDAGVRSVVLCEHPGVETVRTRNPEGFTVRSFDNAITDHKMFGLAPSFRQFVAEDLAAEARRGECLVVLHAIFHPSVYLLSRLFKKHGIPYVLAPHDPYHPAIFEGGKLKKKAYWFFCERRVLRGARAVQVLDVRHAHFLRELGVHTPVIEVVNGFAPGDVPDESSLRFRDANDRSPVSILFLGRLDRMNKGLDLLIDAFAQLDERDVRLTLQGPDRGDRGALEQQARDLSLSDRITFLDADYSVPPSNLALKHDLFVLPSRFEGFGLSALEAMLAARPVLVTDVAGLAPHVRSANAGVVADATVGSIRDHLKGLLSRRSEWREIGMRGRAHVLEELNWTHIGEAALADYRAILRGKSSS